MILVTWKGFFEKINAELDMTNRKKQALESLHNAGRISEFAYECLNKELTDEIRQVEARRKALAEKMTSKLNELEEQRMALEMFLANTEMAHVAGEIDDEIHAKESSALDLGLEATKQELDWIREVALQLVPKETEETETSPTEVQVETTEVPAGETDIEKTSEAAESVQAEVPVEVAADVSEAKVEEIPAPTEAQPDVQTTTSEASEDSFRPQGEETQE